MYFIEVVQNTSTKIYQNLFIKETYSQITNYDEIFPKIVSNPKMMKLLKKYSIEIVQKFSK